MARGVNITRAVTALCLVLGGSVLPASMAHASDVSLRVVSTTPRAGTPGGLPSGAAPQDIASSGGYAFVANPANPSISTINLSNPTNIRVSATTPLRGSPGYNAGLTDPVSIQVSGNYGVAANMSGQAATLLNLTNPLHPTVTGTTPSSGTPGGLPNGSYAADALLDGSTVFVADYNNLGTFSAVDAADKSAPVVVSSTVLTPRDPGLVYTQKLSRWGNLLYVMSWVNYSVFVVDISNPHSPVQIGETTHTGVGSLPFGGSLGGIAAASDGFIVANVLPMASFVSTTDPTHPTVVGTTPQAGSPGSFPANTHLGYVAVSGTMAFISDSFHDAVYAVDFRDHTHPRVIAATPAAGSPGGLKVGSRPAGLTVSGNYVYVANSGTHTVSALFFNQPDLANTGLDATRSLPWAIGVVLIGAASIALSRRRA